LVLTKKILLQYEIPEEITVFLWNYAQNTPLKTLQIMRQAGLSRAQVGFEALTTQILAKLNKKSRLVHNVQSMKNCFELGILVSGNLIVDHPRISAEDLEQSMKAMSLLLGLPPPDDLASFALTVGSPDEQTDADHFLEVTAILPGTRRSTRLRF
jgi:hypothetical protein